MKVNSRTNQGSSLYTCSAVNKEGNIAPRTGFFHFFKRREVLIRAWDQKMEDLKENQELPLSAVADEPKVQRKLKEYDSNLGAYPYPMWKKWVSLVNHVREQDVSRLEPEQQKICSASPLIPREGKVFHRRKRTIEEAMDTSSAGASTSKNCEESLLPEMMAIPGKHFVRFPFSQR